MKHMLTAEQIAGMTAGVINKHLDRLDKESSALIDRLIEAGFGHIGLQQILKMDHPVAQQYAAVSSQQGMLHAEITRRYGPGAPSRLPSRGFGPLKAI
jgi:hypothetical protein